MSNLYLKYFEVNPGDRKSIVGNLFIDPDKDTVSNFYTNIDVNEIKIDLDEGSPLGHKDFYTWIPTEFASALATIMIKGDLHFIDSVLNILTRLEYYEIHLHGIGGSEFSW